MLGDFDVGCIDVPSGGNAQVDLQIYNNILRQEQSGIAAIVCNGTGNTGFITNNVVMTDAPATAIDAGGLQCVNNYYGDFGTALDSDFGPRWLTSAVSDTATVFDMTPEVADNSILANIMTSDGDTSGYNETTDSLEALADNMALGTGCTTAIEADDLDHLIKVAAGTDVYPVPLTADSILAMIMCKGATATASTYDNTTDSLEAISNGLTGQDSAGRNPLLGTQVSRAAADIFDGTTTSLFTIGTGRVLITHFSMQNSIAACDSTANAVKIVMNPTTGTDTDMCATLDVADDHINCLYTITGTFGDAMIQSGAATDGAVGAGMACQVICDVGTIDIQSAGDSGSGGTDVQTSVELWYFPLDDGATVVTAP